MFKSRNVISDGYTRVGCVGNGKLEDGGRQPFESPVVFLYRPLTAAEEVDLGDQLKLKSTEEDKFVYLADRLCKNILWWSEVDDKDAMRPITSENIGSLPPYMPQHLLGVVRGTSYSDPLPDGVDPDVCKQSLREQQKN